MLVSLVLRYLHRRHLRRNFGWSPAVDLSDGRIYSALLTHTNY